MSSLSSWSLQILLGTYLGNRHRAMLYREEDRPALLVGHPEDSSAPKQVQQQEGGVRWREKEGYGGERRRGAVGREGGVVWYGEKERYSGREIEGYGG